MAKTEERQEFIGDRIRRLRDSRRLSIMDVRRACGVSPTTLYRAERGGVVSRRTAERLAPALGVPVSELLEGQP